VAAPRDVSVFVKAMLGEEIDKQRDAVRAWLASSQPSQAGLPPPPSAPSSVSAAAMSFPGEEFSRSRTHGSLPGFEPPRRSRTPLALAILLLVPLAGGAGFWFARNKAAPPPVVAAPPPPVVVQAAPAAAPTEEPVEVTPTPSADPADATARATEKPEAAPAAAAAPAPVRGGARRPAPKKKEAAEEELDVRNPYR
jgi:hypothetical protein